MEKLKLQRGLYVELPKGTVVTCYWDDSYDTPTKYTLQERTTVRLEDNPKVEQVK